MFHKKFQENLPPLRNSGRDKITRNKGEFRDGVCLKHLNGFE